MICSSRSHNCHFLALLAFLAFYPIFLERSAVASPQDEPTNVIDLDLTNIILCDLPVSGELESLICYKLLDDIVDDLEAVHTFVDAMFVGFRDDLPPELLQALESIQAVQIGFEFDLIDGPGGIVSVGGPTSVLFYPLDGPLEYAIPTVGIVTLDVADIPQLVADDRLTDAAAHTVFHAIGFPFAFSQTGLIGASNVFGAINYVGNDGGGFALDEFRNESGNPFAEFVPLVEQGAHLSPFDPTFTISEQSTRELMTPFINTPCIRSFASRTLRGMFADLGFEIAGINAPGIIDPDGDGIEANPLLVQFDGSFEPTLLGDMDGNGSVDLLDVAPFVNAVNLGVFTCAGDFNLDGRLDLADIDPFVQALLNN